MANLVQASKKIALLHRHPENRIKETNAAFPYLNAKGMDVLTFKSFDRSGWWKPLLKSIAWIFYAPALVMGKGYDIIYCDDSFPFYPALVKMVSPKSRVVIRLGDFHLMYYTDGILFNILHYFEVLTWKLADEIICISKAMSAYVNYKINGGSYTVLDPVDPKDFPMDNVHHTQTVMFHGVLSRNKNVDVLLHAAELLPEVDFLIVGYGPDYKRLKSIAPGNVTFYGWIPFKDVHNLIARCGIGVALRSNNRGNDFVVTSPFLQYGIMGKPCLVTKRLVFGDYQWQFTSAQDLARKIKILLNKPEEGTKLRKMILENHDARLIAEQIWNILLA